MQSAQSCSAGAREGGHAYMISLTFNVECMLQISTSLSHLAREAFDRERFEVDMLLSVHLVGVAGCLRLLWRLSLRWRADVFRLCVCPRGWHALLLACVCMPNYRSFLKLN